MQPIASYLSGSTIFFSGCSVQVTLPANTREVWIDSEGGVTYFSINPSGSSASGSSAGYVPQDSVRIIPCIYNLTSLYAFGAASVKGHFQFFG